MMLYADPETHTIQDDNGQYVDVEQAREAYNKLELTDFNLCFQRLAQCDWDWNQLDSFYKENTQ